ncbi:uncharacterized protein [Argopecten irradians]
MKEYYFKMPPDNDYGCFQGTYGNQTGTEGCVVYRQDNEQLRMLKRADKLETSHDRENEVESIVKQDQPDMRYLEYLLEYGTPYKATLLNTAVRKENVAVVAILLTHRADIQLNDAFGCAIDSGNVNIIALLLNSGADPNHFTKRFDYMGFVLGIAVKDRRMDIMKMLLEKGADIREGNVLGCVIRRSKMEITKIILLKPHQTDNDVRPKIAMICIILFLDFIPNEEEPTWKNVICLIPSIKMLIFCGEPRDWTCNDDPIVSDICALPSCELQTHVGKENKNFLVNTSRKGHAIFLESIYPETVFVKMPWLYDQGLAPARITIIINRFFLRQNKSCKKVTCKDQDDEFKERCFDEHEEERDKEENKTLEYCAEWHDNIGESSTHVNDVGISCNDNTREQITNGTLTEKNAAEKYVNKMGENNMEVDEREEGKKKQESNLNENDDKSFENNREKLKENEISTHTNDTLNSYENMQITEITERNGIGKYASFKMFEDEEEASLEWNYWNYEDDDLYNVDITQDSVHVTFTGNRECGDSGALLPSKGFFKEYDSDLSETIVREISPTREHLEEKFTDVYTRLHTFIYMVKPGVDIDLLALAGFINTGERSIVCFSCLLLLELSESIDDPWKEHIMKSPGCAFLRREKGPEYIHRILQQCEARYGVTMCKHSEDHPSDLKERRTLKRERVLDPPDPCCNSPDPEIENGETGIHTMQKRDTLERIILFGEGPNEKERKNFLLLTTKHVLKSMKDFEFTKQKVLNRKSQKKISTIESIEPVRHQCYQRNVYVYYVQNVMTRLSSYSHWPHHNIRTGPLVEAGFSCKDPQTATVICTACGFELDASSLNGTPLKAHQENSPECEFFNQINSRNTDGGETGASSNTASDYAIEGATASADPQVSTDDPKLKDTIGQGEIRDDLRQDNTPSKAPQGNSAGNIHIADAPMHHERGQTDTCIADRPRTGEVFDRTALNVPNSNNVAYSGEAVREIEPMVVGAEASDVPYQIRNARYTELNARRESYTHWPHRNAHDIDRLVNAGFFYTGAEDIVRCFYCDIGLAEWDRDDDPWVEHARHSPECPYLRNQKGQDYINNIQTQWARIYTPKHPQHSQVEERRRTFRHENWPRDNVLQTPDQLAAAGFFYTGDGDTVRCHYCDGGLREWEPEDDPWVEHARWFPFCKFVLKIKGIDFIQASATGNPGIAQQAPVAPPAPRPSEAPQTLSYVDTCRIKEQRNPLYSAAAQSVRSMGYSKATIRMVINCYIENTGRRDFKATDLMDIIMDKEETDEVILCDDGEDSEDEIGPDAGIAAAGGNIARGGDEEMELSPAAMKKENEYLKKKFK